jgi:uncharacterized membrane protein (DUF2068 family)
MVLASRLGIKRFDGLLLCIFYAVVGIMQLVVLVYSASTLIPPHIGALGVLSLIAAYGLLRTKKWSVWLVIALFFPQLVFAAVSLNTNIILFSSASTSALLIDTALAAFIVLSLVGFLYVSVKRKTFE